jgi:hypothetical protein
VGHRHKAFGKWTTTDDAESHPADVLTVADVSKLLLVARGDGGTVPVPNPPPTPPPDITAPTVSGVSVTVTTTTAVVICATDEAATVQVEYGTTTGYGTTTSATSSGTSHSRTLSGLTPGQTYHYRIRATDTAGNLRLDGDRTFTTSASATLPGAPTNLVATGGNTQAVLTWAAPASNGGSAITGYHVYRNGASLTTLGVVLTYTNTGLTNGLTYTYTVAAITAVGEGPQSASASATPATAGDINPPIVSNVVISGITTTGATISWTTNEAATGVVQYGPTAAYGQTTSATSSGTAHSRTLTGLMPATPVHFRIVATDTAGNVRQDSDRTFTTLNTTPAFSGVYGPAIAGDGKDNRPIGRSDDSHVAFRWHSLGGTITGFAFNQRFGPDNANPGLGYSHGTGGTIRATVQGVTSGGLPDGNVLGSVTFAPSNPNTDAETKTFISFTPFAVSARDLALVLDNIHADPTNNWMSANVFWVGTADSPRQPAFPDDKMAVLERGNFTSGAWRVKTDNTPVFDVVFQDGHHEGQQFFSVIANTDLGSGSGTQGWVLNGARRVRQTFTTGGTFQAAWLRVRRVSGSGSLTAYLGAATSSAASVDFIPASAYGTLTGGRWVRCPFSSPVTIAAGANNVKFSSNAECVVMPIREVEDEDTSPGWQSRGFLEGKAEKSTDGTSWSDLYNSYTDLQCYLEPS